MNIQQIEWLKSLDKDGTFGTLQGVLMNPDLSKAPFESVSKYIITCMCDERSVLMQENERMRKALEKHGMYTSEIALGRERWMSC